jgi:transposase
VPQHPVTRPAGEANLGNERGLHPSRQPSLARGWQRSCGWIAKLCSASCSGVRKIINLFNRGGIGALQDKPHKGGRPRKTDDRYVALLKQAVQSDPRQLGYVFGCWTLERLREHLARKTRVIISTGYLRRLMAENKIVYHRPKHGMNHLRDPKEYNDKKAFLEFVKKGPVQRTQPSICSTWTNVRFISTRP